MSGRLSTTAAVPSDLRTDPCATEGTRAPGRESGSLNVLPGATLRRRTVLYLERNVDGTIGGSYRSLLYLVKLLPKNQYKPVVAFYRSHHLLTAFEQAGCKVVLLTYPSAVRLVDRFVRLQQFPGVRSLLVLVQRTLNFGLGSTRLFADHCRLLLRERIDLVHLNNGVMGGTELLLASRLLGIRTIAHQRGIGPLPPSFPRVRRLIDHVISVSEAARNNLVEQGLDPRRCTTIHNGIDPHEFRATITRDRSTVRRSLGIPDDALLVGNSGMLKAWKGQHVLVEAVARLSHAYPDLHCLIVGGVSDQHDGDAAYARRIEQIVVDHDLTGRVQILGYQPNVAQFVQAFDIMVHTSVEPEPFSRSVLEGMSLGRALIGTRTGGTPEAIEHGVTGLLVPPGDVDALAAAIARLIATPDLRERLGSQAHQRIRERFSIRTNASRTVDIYDAVCGTRGHRR
jgi:glycosyltransferase involved in cell wall biosynthesis